MLLVGPVVLRAFEPGDWSLEQRLSRDPDVVRWTYYPADLDDQAARARVRASLERAGQGLVQRYSIRDLDGRPLGSCGLGRLDDVPEVFYAVLSEHRGRGIATAALRMLSDWVLDAGVPEVALETIEHNLASERVAQKAGFWVQDRFVAPHRGTQVTLTRWVRRERGPADLGVRR